MHSQKESDDPPLRPSETSAVWTTADLKGLFRDAVDSGQLPASRILDYAQSDTGALLARIENLVTGQVLFYEMDPQTKVPRRVRRLKPVK